MLPELVQIPVSIATIRPDRPHSSYKSMVSLVKMIFSSSGVCFLVTAEESPRTRHAAKKIKVETITCRSDEGQDPGNEDHSCELCLFSFCSVKVHLISSGCSSREEPFLCININIIVGYVSQIWIADYGRKAGNVKISIAK